MNNMQVLLSTLCMALTSLVIGNAYYQKKQFYPAVVYITKSNASMAVIYMQFFVMVFMFGKLLRKIFLGTLRTAEFEHLLERFWYALTETCLAFTVFRDDFNPRFVALFTVMLFLKSFHWLAEERVDFMERSPVIGLLFHTRVTSLLTLLGTMDYLLLMHAYNMTITRGPTVQLVFGFEYAILLTVVASTAIKYVLHTAEMRTDTPWENKAVFLLYTELVIGLFKVVLYVLFVIIMAKIYALPMFVFRPMFFTIRNFKKALSDVIMSRRAIRNMNTLYPDATPEELRLSDNICIICREDMISNSKKLPCGHIFHTTCLRSWFQRQQTCPTCRLNILRVPTANSTAIPRTEDATNAAAPATVGTTITVQPHATSVDNSRSEGNASNSANAFDNSTGPLAGSFSNFVGLRALQSTPITLPPFMMPPPFPFFTPYAVPPPPMPSDLTNFTDEELQALEGIERQNVEERIKCLRNIQLMLDAVGVLMNNYQIACATMNAQANPTNQDASEKTKTTVATDTALQANRNIDEPTTSSAAAAAAAATCSSSTLAAAAVASGVQTNVRLDFQTKQYVVPGAASAIAAAATTNATTATSYNHNAVTVEDLDGDENELGNAIAPCSSAMAATSISTTDSSELSELRKRRLKFLEERNKTEASAD